MLSSKRESLLSCLLHISQHFNLNVIRESLTAGLPIDSDMLSDDLFYRMAERAGLVAELFNSPLTAIPHMLLPCILKMSDGQCVVLTQLQNHQATIYYPSSTDGEQIVESHILAEQFSGQGYFIKRKMMFDARAPETLKPKQGHWFWSAMLESLPIYKDVLIASILINVFAITSPIFTMNVYDKVVPNLAFESLWVLSIGAVIVFTFDIVLRQLRSYFIDIAGKKADLILSARIFSKVLGIRFENRPISTGAFARHIQEFESIREFFTSATVSSLIDLPFAFLFMIVIWVFSGWLVVIPVIAIVFMMLYSIYIQIPLRKAIEESSRLSSQKYATVIESIAGLESLKIQNAEGQFQQKWEQAVSHMANSGIETRRITNLVSGLAGYIQQMTTVGLIIMGVYEISEGNLTQGGLIAAVMLAGRAISPMIQLAVLSTRYNQAKSALVLLENIMSTPSEYDEAKSYLNYPKFNGSIEFDNVSFKYPESNQYALKNVSFKIQPGEKVAIIGRIGAGKTTLEKLLVGLFAPTEGSIRIDGFDINQLHPTTLRSNIGCIPQDFTLFFGSIRQNIQLGYPFIQEDKILQAAQKAGVTQFTNADENGLDRVIGEGGQNLSGGQRQSIALARALLLEPSILVLDEPTANMDNRSENIVKHELSILHQNPTLLLITHRTSMLDIVDRLIILENGSIVANGPKDQVLQELQEGKIRSRVS